MVVVWWCWYRLEAGCRGVCGGLAAGRQVGGARSDQPLHAGQASSLAGGQLVARLTTAVTPTLPGFVAQGAAK